MAQYSAKYYWNNNTYRSLLKQLSFILGGYWKCIVHMKKYLLIFCLLIFAPKLFAQQFAQYNTGTLYDSFENPAERSFIPDSSRMYASNFFFPTLDGNVFLTGDAQQTLKERLVKHTYMNSNLQIGGLTGGGSGEGPNPTQQIGSTGHLNYLDANANAIAIEHIKIENEGFERDTSVVEPTEPTLTTVAA